MQGGFLVSLFYLYIKLILLELYRSKKVQYKKCIVLFCARNRSRTCTSVGNKPLKPARLPIPPYVHKLKKLSKCLTFCDRAGARTQDPLLKREMLYQLSYPVIASL